MTVQDFGFIICKIIGLSKYSVILNMATKSLVLLPLRNKGSFPILSTDVAT